MWPKWIGPALWLTLAACLLLMFWRGRRLGRLVTEPLPVIVPCHRVLRADWRSQDARWSVAVRDRIFHPA